MRDDQKRWPEVKRYDRDELFGSGVAVRAVQLDRQTMISGSLSACLNLAGLKENSASSENFPGSSTYAIRLRRDRILVVGGPELEEGWIKAAEVAVSEMTTAYSVIDISGNAAESLLATGTEFNSRSIGPSASYKWHGFDCLIYRRGTDGGTWRLHVRSAHLDAVWDMLKCQIGLISTLPTVDGKKCETPFTSTKQEGDAASIV